MNLKYYGIEVNGKLVHVKQLYGSKDVIVHYGYVDSWGLINTIFSNIMYLENLRMVSIFLKRLSLKVKPMLCN